MSPSHHSQRRHGSAAAGGNFTPRLFYHRRRHLLKLFILSPTTPIVRIRHLIEPVIRSRRATGRREWRSPGRLQPTELASDQVCLGGQGGRVREGEGGALREPACRQWASTAKFSKAGGAKLSRGAAEPEARSGLRVRDEQRRGDRPQHCGADSGRMLTSRPPPRDGRAVAVRKRGQGGGASEQREAAPAREVWARVKYKFG